jgi:hypothetical protein
MNEIINMTAHELALWIGSKRRPTAQVTQALTLWGAERARRATDDSALTDAT